MRRERYISFAVKSLNNQIKRALDRSALPDNAENLTGMQYALIGFIHEESQNGSVYQRDIEAEFNIRRSTASGQLQLLEQNGMIRRESVDSDARLKKITLTDRGMQLDNQARENIQALEARMTQGIQRPELEQFFATVEKFRENLEA